MIATLQIVAGIVHSRYCTPRRSPMVLAEKIALVTGAGRGMGRAIALQYAQAGATVATADIDGQTAQETSAAIEAAGGRSLPIQADVGELASIDRMVQQAVETFGRLDVIVN